MAEDNKKTEEKSESTIEEKKQEKLKNYEQLIDRLKKEKKQLKEDMNNEYREARRYVRSHPEEGVLFAFIGGIALGYLFGKLGRRD
ncbi:MAG: hypothetical protein PVH63_08950 [Balneolaceae bacterium]|jgi:ElaB/YqjD/DUF883 family membrane-anchored ribosome-binding protein